MRRAAPRPALSTWQFPTPSGADEGLGRLRENERARRLQIQAGALLRWPVGRNAPRTYRLNDLAASGAILGALLGVLVDLSAGFPGAGTAAGVLLGGPLGWRRSPRLGEEALTQARQNLVPGASALVLGTRDADLDQLAHDHAGPGAQLRVTDRPARREQDLRRTLTDAAHHDRG
ncbi:MAG: DUF1269 domain-containing protein [Actinomycetota bacterium]|nr:DUF1269 domain-containing protein [Actinomycetota bacterium]